VTRPRPWFAVAAVAMLAIAGTVPLPGVHQRAALGQLGRVAAWWVDVAAPFPPAFSILSTGLIGLVIARFALALAVNPRQPAPSDRAWTMAITMMYVSASWLGGVALALTLHHRFADLYVGDPVLGALVDGTAIAVGAALAWALADLVRASGVASGALVLFGAWELTRIGRYAIELAAAAAAGEPELPWLALHGGFIPLALMMLALWRWTPRSGPIVVWRGLTVRSSLDLLMLPLVAGGLASLVADDLLGHPSWTPQPPLYDPGLLPRTLASVLVVPAVGAWSRRHAGAPGSVGWLFGALALLGLTIGAAGGLWLLGG
jgi:hypothetical protein